MITFITKTSKLRLTSSRPQRLWLLCSILTISTLVLTRQIANASAAHETNYTCESMLPSSTDTYQMLLSGGELRCDIHRAVGLPGKGHTDLDLEMRDSSSC